MRYPCVVYNHVSSKPFELLFSDDGLIAMTEMEFIHFLVSVSKAMEDCANVSPHRPS